MIVVKLPDCFVCDSTDVAFPNTPRCVPVVVVLPPKMPYPIISQQRRCQLYENEESRAHWGL